ncbi:uncharacterized protein LOC124291162 [Haliotis rubra]|uniref:uncharacterized protein LOC124291162 n=1 Tax=Haliotis rubra TaxID=36100 RepID=UPI001EE5BBB0|nr:uncharacterized protein LOC124291162 [Haliotis rubra]
MMSGRKRTGGETQTKSAPKRAKKSVPREHIAEPCDNCRHHLGQTQGSPNVRCLHLQEHYKYKDHLKKLFGGIYNDGSLSVILNFEGKNSIPDVHDVIRTTEEVLKKHQCEVQGKELTPSYVMLIDTSCPLCAKCVSEVRKGATGQVLSMHMDIAAVNSKSKKQKEENPELTEERIEVMNHFMRNVCALQNISGGGSIIVHFVGKDEADPGTYIGWFDEMVNTKLNGLLPPGELFFNNFKRKRLEDYGYVIQFDVASNSTLSTVDMKTKVPLDDCFLDLDLASLGTFMRDLPSKSQTVGTRLQLQTGHTTFDDLHESRHVQLKQFPHKYRLASATDKANIIWNSLKLGETISAFSKQDEGGTYYCGIREKVRFLRRYKTISSEVSGIPLEQEEETSLKTNLKEKIEREMVAVNGNFDVDTEKLSVSIDTKDHNQKKILVVNVPAYPGLVFYDERGPVSYKYDEDVDIVRPLELAEWCKAIKNQNI